MIFLWPFVGPYTVNLWPFKGPTLYSTGRGRARVTAGGGARAPSGRRWWRRGNDGGRDGKPEEDGRGSTGATAAREAARVGMVREAASGRGRGRGR